MATLVRILLAAAGGALGGAVGGFLAAIVALQARRIRNGRLIARGEPAFKDAILPIAFLPMSAIVGCIVAAPLGGFIAPLRAALVGAMIPTALLILISVVGVLWQLFD